MEISVGNKYFLFKVAKSGLSMIRTENGIRFCCHTPHEGSASAASAYVTEISPHQKVLRPSRNERFLAHWSTIGTQSTEMRPQRAP
jgi:hypothetical protein